MILFKITYIKD